VPPPPLLSRHPFHTLFDAAKTLIQTHARRLPLLDHDSETGHEVIVSTLTQYRLLKFISINVRSLLFLLSHSLHSFPSQCPKECQNLHTPLRKLGIGTYVSQSRPTSETGFGNYNTFHPIATAYMSTRVSDVVHIFSGRSVSAVPIIDDDGIVVNLYETVDVIVRLICSIYRFCS
jgi:5'-AMP-activated protein kinase, regulatory gamma subunit